MSTLDTDLRDELKDFLERLGRTVEVRRDGQLLVRHRTALVEEEMQFKLLDSSEAKPLKKKAAINIVAEGVPLPDRDEYPNCFYFDEFLDRSIQADALASAIASSEDVQQHVG